MIPGGVQGGQLQRSLETQPMTTLEDWVMYISQWYEPLQSAYPDEPHPDAFFKMLQRSLHILGWEVDLWLDIASILDGKSIQSN